jgi:hypothetical protein
MRVHALVVLSPLMCLVTTGCTGSVEIAKDGDDASPPVQTPDAGPLADSPVAMDATATLDSSHAHDAGPVTDGTTGAGRATTYFLSLLSNGDVDSGACLPAPLPVDGAGQAECQAVARRGTTSLPGMAELSQPKMYESVRYVNTAPQRHAVASRWTAIHGKRVGHALRLLAVGRAVARVLSRAAFTVSTPCTRATRWPFACA